MSRNSGPGTSVGDWRWRKLRELDSEKMSTEGTATAGQWTSAKMRMTVMEEGGLMRWSRTRRRRKKGPGVRRAVWRHRRPPRRLKRVARDAKHPHAHLRLPHRLLAKLAHRSVALKRKMSNRRKRQSNCRKTDDASELNFRLRPRRRPANAGQHGPSRPPSLKSRRRRRLKLDQLRHRRRLRLPPSLRRQQRLLQPRRSRNTSSAHPSDQANRTRRVSTRRRPRSFPLAKKICRPSTRAIWARSSCL